MQQLLKEVEYPAEAPSRLFIDNQSAISVAKNPEHHGQMKHLDLAYYWLRDKVEKRRIEMKHLRTGNASRLVNKGTTKATSGKTERDDGISG